MKSKNKKESRYSRQIVYLGKKNQLKLSKSSVIVVGCGATGSVALSLLVRAGLGFIKIIDRDFIEPSNLQTSMLFTENDTGKPKALTARQRLKEINPDCRIEAVVDELNQRTTGTLSGFDLILDCTDNLETRHLINEFCIKNKKLWVFSAALGAEGMSAVFKGKPCFRCLFPKDIKPGSLETCETLGILHSTSAVAGAWQALDAIKILTEFDKSRFNLLFHFSLKEGKFQFSRIKPDKNCPVCVKKKFRLLEQKPNRYITSLCGRDSYHISFRKLQRIDLRALANRFRKNPEYKASLKQFVLHLNYKKYRISVFGNGGVIIRGSKSVQYANSLYARILGI